MRVLPLLKEIRPALGLELGVQLALGQLAAHHALTAADMAADVCIAHAIYGRDRLVDGRTTQLVGVLSATTAIATAASVLWLHHQDSLSAMPVLCWLATLYKSSKRVLAPAKPLVVGNCWAYAITALPYDTHDPGLYAFYALLYGAASNLMDVGDAADDAAAGVDTPASRLTPGESHGLSAVLFGGAIAAHALARVYTNADLALDALAVAGIAWCAYNATVEGVGW